MSLDNQDEEHIVTRTGQHLTLRLYSDKDYHKVRELFMYCMGYGPGSPREIAIANQLRQPFVYAAYSISTVGLALTIRPSLTQTVCAATYRVSSNLPFPIRTVVSKSHVLNYLIRPSSHFPILHLQSHMLVWPLVLSVISAGTLLAFLAFVNFHVFIGFYKRSLSEDLNDISGHYQSPGAHKKGGRFWVIEGVDKDSIVACIGLDATGAVPELRRMCVHPSYRSLGLGHRLIEALVEHTVKHNAQCEPKFKILEIILGTTTYSPAAMRLYERYGWVVERKVQLLWYVRGFYLFTMKRRMDFASL